MRTRREVIGSIALFTGTALSLAACGQGATSTSPGTPPPATGAAAGGTPQSAADLTAAAQKEGRVVVYSTTDSASFDPLLKDFNAAFSGIKIDYNDLNSTEVYNRFTSESAAGAESADFLWSSAMDLQIKLVSDGLALQYASPEASKLPDWATYKNQAYGTTQEPLAFIYNKRVIAQDAAPQSHADLAKALADKLDVYKGKVTCYDPEKSGVGYLLNTQDLKYDPNFWNLAKVLGTAGVVLQTSTGTMIEKVMSGENVFGWNIIASYVLPKMKQDPMLALVFPKDYTLALSRIGFIAKASKRPNAAKVFLNYLLSKRGQDVMAKQSLLYSIRPDSEGDATAAAVQKELGAKLKPIPVSDELLQALDQTKRLDFFSKWQQALGRR